MRIILTGLGNVGRSFLQILGSQATILRDRYGLSVTVVGVADSAGAAFDPDGLSLVPLAAAKAARHSVGAVPIVGRLGMTGLELLSSVDADVLLEATPVNLTHGQPGLDLVRSALSRGIACVLANKGPLALAYQELASLSDLTSIGLPGLRFSACVGGALPTINLGVRDLAGARILRVEAILNGTCQGILRAMESGQDFAAALTEMQRRGVAETDPTLDVDGWDQAVKLVILANAVLRRPTVLGDLSVRGIRDIRVEDLRAAEQRGERLVLLGRAEREAPNDDWKLTVGPVSLPGRHPLARMGANEMGIVYSTDISGTLHATSEEADAVPTAAAMLRDLIDLG
ncbi:MAG: homoserine dehydrogenase [Gemmatimonadota bacterium]